MQRPVSRRRWLHLCGGAAVVGFSGCVGDGDSASSNGNGGGNRNGGEDTEGGNGDTGHENSWDALGFTDAGYYEFEVYNEDQGTGTMRWAVEDVDDDTISTTYEYVHGDVQFSGTSTGTRSNVQNELFMTPMIGLLSMTLFSPAILALEDEELEVGNGWTSPTPDGMLSYKVDRIDSYAGIDCYMTEMSLDGQVMHETCVSPDHGLALHSAFYNEAGDVVMYQTLLEYRSDIPDDFGRGGEPVDYADAPEIWTHLPALVPGTYEYDLYIADEGNGSMTWDLLEISGDSVMADLTYELEGSAFEELITGNSSERSQQFASSPAQVFYARYLLGTPLFMLPIFHGEKLAVGDGWTSDGTSWEIVERREHAGIDCFVIEAREDGELEMELWLAPAFETPVYVAHYDGGELAFELELTDYRP